MRDQTDFDPVFFAPFVSSPVVQEGRRFAVHDGQSVRDILFDRAVAEAFELLGLGASPRSRHAFSLSTSEIFRKERKARPTGSLRATLCLLDHDPTRVHFLLRLHDIEGGAVVAESERVITHLDAEGREPVPFPAPVRRRLEDMRLAHAPLETLVSHPDRPLPKN
ncbi:MAG: thioesterase family protein [Pseudomonadota bacterium]